MSKAKRYLEGFQLISELAPGGLQTYGVATTVTIAKGDAVSSNGSGYAKLATALDTTFLGIAVADADNSAGANGAINVQVIPPLRHHRFIVQVEANAVLTIANVGIVYDLSTEDGIAINDVTITATGFKIEEIDISTESLAANTYGHAIGHFEPVS